MKCAQVRHGSRRQAEKARDRIERKRGYLLQFYRCNACKGWHLGNDRETRLENLNRAFDRLPATDRATHLRGDA